MAKIQISFTAFRMKITRFMIYALFLGGCFWSCKANWWLRLVRIGYHFSSKLLLFSRSHRGNRFAAALHQLDSNLQKPMVAVVRIHLFIDLFSRFHRAFCGDRTSKLLERQPADLCRTECAVPLSGWVCFRMNPEVASVISEDNHPTIWWSERVA